MLTPHRPMVLIILDGWGYREEIKYNAIQAAKTPNWDNFWRHYPHKLISGSGKGVGLPENQMGNSEVGHLNIGAGRVVYQEYTRIEKSIEDESFYINPVLLKALHTALQNNKAVHVMGLLSPGGVHSHEHQILTMLRLAAKQGIQKLYLHAFLDGRDTPPKSAGASIAKAQQLFSDLGSGQIASLIGRYYAMDRDHRWERIQSAYDLLTQGKAYYHADDPLIALQLAYARGESDEFVKATAIHKANETPIVINDGDVIIFMNYRADRARELTHAFIDSQFNGFHREKNPHLGDFVSLTQYEKGLPVSVAFEPINLTNVLGEYIANLGLKQLRIAETEKYAHVTFFINGGREDPFPGEDRILVPSPKISTYDLKPEMSAYEVTEKLITAIQSKHYDLIICNFANPDMVGHTGNFSATVKAIETIDQCLGKIADSTLTIGGEIIITADHGNAECMFDENTQQPHTAHTHELVPIVYLGRGARVNSREGALSDIAPTILKIMQLPQPKEMTGQPLFILE